MPSSQDGQEGIFPCIGRCTYNAPQALEGTACTNDVMLTSFGPLQMGTVMGSLVQRSLKLSFNRWRG